MDQGTDELRRRFARKLEHQEQRGQAAMRLAAAHARLHEVADDLAAYGRFVIRRGGNISDAARAEELLRTYMEAVVEHADARHEYLRLSHPSHDPAA
jgi:hypothetical protein